MEESHGHGGLYQAEGLHEKRPAVNNESAVDWGRKADMGQVTTQRQAAYTCVKGGGASFGP